MSALPTPARSPSARAAAGSATASASAARAVPARLEDLDVGIVSHHEPVGARQWGAAADPNITPDQACLYAVLQVADLRAREHDRVLELGPADPHLLADRGVRADVGVGDLGAAAHDRRATHGGALEPRPRLDRHPALHPAVHELAVKALLEV